MNKVDTDVDIDEDSQYFATTRKIITVTFNEFILILQCTRFRLNLMYMNTKRVLQLK